ncbi:MAG TPA: ABC transporter substrate-binding protein, partial [Anaerolineales bacterium]
FSMVLASCGPTPTTTPPAVATIPPTAVPTTPPARHGGWLDQIVFSVVQSDSAVTQIQAGAIDLFAYGLTSANLAAIQAAGLKYAASMGTYYTIMYMPAACTDANTVNPFADHKIREATNMLYDRNYINQEIYAGGALAKFFSITTNGIDYADLADVARGLEAKYAFNETKAIADIATEMSAMPDVTQGADGKWQFKGKPVTLIFLIRSDGDGSRKPMGDYVAAQLEKAGFTVDRQYKKGSEAAPIWQRTSVECQWNLYTGGWGSTGLSRDDRGQFQQMYCANSVQGIEPFLSNVCDPAYQKVADDLANANFTSVEQRRAMMVEAMNLSMQDSLQVMMVDTQSFAPYSTNVQISANLAAGLERALISTYTARFVGQEGGTLKFGETDLFSEPWNPVAGSNWAWDNAAINATKSDAFMPDPYTGLVWPLRAEKAELTVQTGLPIFKSLDWITLTTAATIAVPADAWVDWDATTQKFIPAGDGKTAKIKSTIYYPANMFDTVTWHDGAKLSVADFVMAMIEFFDRAKPESAIYDEQAVPYFESFMSSFKGVKIVSTSPLVIDTYSDNYIGDAELDITTWWPNYGFAEAPWDIIAVANLSEAAGETAYSADKSTAKTIEQTSFIGGPTLTALAKNLDQAIAAKTIPYAPTMGAYLTADEAAARYAALKTFYTNHGTFWVGTGPYFLYKAFLVEKSLILQNYTAFPDTPDRWANFAEPKIAVVDITGPAGSVKIGSEAKFDVAVTFGGQPYASADLKMVKYLLYDATNTLVKSDMATLVSEGNYQVVLPAAVTAALAAGSNKLEIAVVSNLVAVPTFNSVQFVTAP